MKLRNTCTPDKMRKALPSVLRRQIPHTRTLFETQRQGRCGYAYVRTKAADRLLESFVKILAFVGGWRDCRHGQRRRAGGNPVGRRRRGEPGCQSHRYLARVSFARWHRECVHPVVCGYCYRRRVPNCHSLYCRASLSARQSCGRVWRERGGVAL